MQDAVVVQRSDRTRNRAAAAAAETSILERHNKIGTIGGCCASKGQGAEPAGRDRKAAGYYDRPRAAESGPLTQAVDHAALWLLGFCDAVWLSVFWMVLSSHNLSGCICLVLISLWPVFVLLSCGERGKDRQTLARQTPACPVGVCLCACLLSR